MHGLDGNYLKMQGDALARLQVAYQSEQNRQQILAQLESVDNLRKLREQVQETEKESNSSRPNNIQDEQSSNNQSFAYDESFNKNEENSGNEELEVSLNNKNHIDIKV